MLPLLTDGLFALYWLVCGVLLALVLVPDRYLPRSWRKL